MTSPRDQRLLEDLEISTEQMLETLELYAEQSHDTGASLAAVSLLKELLSADEIENFEALIEEFSESRREKIYQIYHDYALDRRKLDRFALLLKPETLLVFWRLEKDRFKLLDLWCQHWPQEELRFLALVWGVKLPSE